MYDLCFGDLVGYVAYVYYPGRLVVGGFVEFDLKFFFTLLKHTGHPKRANQDGRWDLGPHASRTHRLWLSRGPQTNDRANSILRPKGEAQEGMGERDEAPVVELLFTAFL